MMLLHEKEKLPEKQIKMFQEDVMLLHKYTSIEHISSVS